MFVYRTSFIDFWDGWQRPADVFKVSNHYDARFDISERYLTPELWTITWERAKRAALLLGWEGDIREGPFVSMCPIPDYDEDVYENDGTFFIAWKQDNNGETFIASPVALDYLLKHDWNRCAFVPRQKQKNKQGV